MADKVYLAAKPGTVPIGTTAGAATNGALPETKSHPYGASRSFYSLPAPIGKKSKHKRGCYCRCCIWTTVFLLIIVFLAVIAGVVVHILYSPHPPMFTVSSLKISNLKLTSSSSETLTTNINMNIMVRNPNKKLVYAYNPISITLVTSSNDIVLGTGIVSGFVQGKKTTTFLQATVRSNGEELDDTSAKNLKAELKNKNGMGLKVVVETKVKVKLGGVTSPKVGIRVTCDGIKGSVPSGKTPTSASLGSSKCKVDLRIKIWKWTF